MSTALVAPARWPLASSTPPTPPANDDDQVPCALLLPDTTFRRSAACQLPTPPHHHLPPTSARPLLVSRSRLSRRLHTGHADEVDIVVVDNENASSRPLIQPSTRHARVVCVSLPTELLASTSSSPDRPDTMDTAEGSVVSETLPSTPPGLSYKGSNSSTSSFRTDSMCEDSTGEKLAHFEEVGLGDDTHDEHDLDDCNVKPESRPTLRRPTSRTLSARGEQRASRVVPISPGVIDDRLPSPNAPSLPSPHDPSTYLTSRGFSSRSPSPRSNPLLPHRFPSTPSLTSLVPRTSWDRHIANSMPRRLSWQPARKSVAELEAEYNDEDEDVPDEAILENVPITPTPGMPALFPATAPRRKTPSPQRRFAYAHQSGAHGNLHSANVPKHARRPLAPLMPPNGQYGAPRGSRHARPPMLPHSATAPSLHGDTPAFQRRSKSWSEHLNDEARELSVALEAYAARQSTEKRDSAMSMPSKSASSSPPRSASSAKMQTRTSILELPPVQKGNIMIDPLPISKEKEAVLTRTRPSWLPPKSQKEERRHMKEWEQMMARAREAERKRASREKEDMEAHGEMEETRVRVWEQSILPRWDEVIHEPSTRQLWWQGVAPASRAQVWSKAIGNELGLTPTSYEAALRRAEQVIEKAGHLPAEERSRSKEAAWMDSISRDVPNVFAEQPVFGPDGPLHKALTEVLKAYSMYRSDVGYVYGTHLIAGLLCLHMEPAAAFVALANVMNRPVPLAFLVHDTSAMARTYEMVLDTLKYKIPHLHSHLTAPATRIHPEEYLDPMFRCLFTYNLCPEHASRLWDIYVFEGDKTLVRAAVAVLGKLEPRLYGSRDDILDAVSWRNETEWSVGIADEFIRAVREAGKVDDKPRRTSNAADQ